MVMWPGEHEEGKWGSLRADGNNSAESFSNVNQQMMAESQPL